MVTPRPTRLLGTEFFNGLGLRVWQMRANEFWPPAQTHEAARPLVERFATEIAGAAGFMIVHAARPALFVLAHIWDGVDLYQRYWTAPLTAPVLLTPHRDGAIGCVWELELLAAERERWAAVCDLDDAASIYLAP